MLDTAGRMLAVGDEARFDVSYGALLRAMTSPFVEKTYVEADAEMTGSRSREGQEPAVLV